MFKVGDNVQFTYDAEPKIPKGTRGVVVQGKNIPYGHTTVKWDSFPYEILTYDDWMELYVPVTNIQITEVGYIDFDPGTENTAKRSQQLKPCTCEMSVLMRNGCICGAIAKKEWGLIG